jgi:hypothetical protein
MANTDGFDDFNTNEGMLELNIPDNTSQMSQIKQQFSDWMKVKNASNLSGVTSRIVANLVTSVQEKDNQLHDKYCFNRGGYEKGTGYDKSTFDKACV